MKKLSSTSFLKGVVIFIGLVVLAVCVFAIPVGIRDDQVGYYRPILLGLYITAIPFYFGLYQALNLLNYIDQNKAFSELSIRALKKIKYNAIVISVMFTAGLPYIFNAADKDDAPGVVAIALVIIFASVVIATFAALLQKLMRSGLDLKSENDLTV